MLRGFNVSPKLAGALVKGKEAADQALLSLFRLGEPNRSQIYHLLAPLETEYLLYMMAKSRQEASRRFISLFFTHLKKLKPELTGAGPGGPGLPARAADQRDAGAAAGGADQREGQEPEGRKGLHPARLRPALMGASGYLGFRAKAPAASTTWTGPWLATWTIWSAPRLNGRSGGPEKLFGQALPA